MDGSRRSAHGNAYFTGFGAAKRIVFFDTLLARLSGSEIEAVLAHELGHFKRRHVIKRMIVTFVHQSRNARAARLAVAMRVVLRRARRAAIADWRNNSGLALVLFLHCVARLHVLRDAAGQPQFAQT
jgi:STE24 endopeptidase